MRDPIWVPRDQLLKCLRDAGWGFKRRAKRVEIWKRHGSTDRIDLPTNKAVHEDQVRVVLFQAGLTKDGIDRFLQECVSTDRP